MGTTKQKKLAKVIVENSVKDAPDTAGKLLEKVGYSKNLVKQPGRVIEQQGVKEELAVLGFTEENAMKVVTEIMTSDKAQDKDRLKATELTFKVHGSFAPEKKAIVNLNVDIKDEKAQEIADKYEGELQDKFLG